MREAEDACIWLKSAGFPQYVQKFEGKQVGDPWNVLLCVVAGEFPLNLTKLKVEKDHSFLDSPAIDALIKWVYVIN